MLLDSEDKADMMHISCKINFLMTIMALSALLVNPVRADAAQKTILAFGDSLTSGYGLSPKDSFPAQLERKLKEQGYDITVINAGAAGETTSGGATRLEWTLEQKKPDFVILELGGNDMLRAIDPEITFNNLHKMMEILKKHEIPVLLAGMKADPNLGEKFEIIYSVMYERLAEKYNAVYYPFFLEGVFSRSGLFQKNGMHPNAEGVAVIVHNILPFVEKLLTLTPPPRTLPE
ncbi:MAG: arylesterase [Pseudomonadota bacterium]